MLSFLRLSEDTAKELDFTNFEELIYALHTLRLFVMTSSNNIIINVLLEILFSIIEN